MVGLHHRLNGREFDGQGGLRAEGRGVAKSRT